MVIVNGAALKKSTQVRDQVGNSGESYIPVGTVGLPPDFDNPHFYFYSFLISFAIWFLPNYKMRPGLTTMGLLPRLSPFFTIQSREKTSPSPTALRSAENHGI